MAYVYLNETIVIPLSRIAGPAPKESLWDKKRWNVKRK